MFPIAIQTIHAMDGHEHPICNDLSTHLHKKQLDCSICDFHFNIFDFKPQQLPEFVGIAINSKYEIEYHKSEIPADAAHFFLRGPPLFS